MGWANDLPPARFQRRTLAFVEVGQSTTAVVAWQDITMSQPSPSPRRPLRAGCPAGSRRPFALRERDDESALGAGLGPAKLDDGHTVVVAAGQEDKGPAVPAPRSTLNILLDQLYQGNVVGTADIARVTGTSPRSVARWRVGDVAPHGRVEERLRELHAVVDLASRVIPDDAARLWIRSPNPDLGYEKPLDLVTAGDDEQVVSLLLALAEGVTA